jgi:hypothetical protein
LKVVLKVCEFCHIPVLVELLSAKNEPNLLISHTCNCEIVSLFCNKAELTEIKLNNNDGLQMDYY